MRYLHNNMHRHIYFINAIMLCKLSNRVYKVIFQQLILLYGRLFADMLLNALVNSQVYTYIEMELLSIGVEMTLHSRLLTLTVRRTISI